MTAEHRNSGGSTCHSAVISTVAKTLSRTVRFVLCINPYRIVKAYNYTKQYVEPYFRNSFINVGLIYISGICF